MIRYLLRHLLAIALVLHGLYAFSQPLYAPASRLTLTPGKGGFYLYCSLIPTFARIINTLSFTKSCP
ncbi:hypothetical protein [Arsenicibacter rosenii]|nr:hypothetical protein [Arsenicibacter rosenii]